jgi:hypothetical protein
VLRLEGALAYLCAAAGGGPFGGERYAARETCLVAVHLEGARVGQRGDGHGILIGEPVHVGFAVSDVGEALLLADGEGVGDGNPDVLSTLDDRFKAKNLGFIQCAEITYDCTLGSDMRGKPNIDAVGVVFYGDGNLNKYQMGKFLDIVNHVKQAGKLDEIEVVAYRPLSPADSRFITYINLKNLEGAY